MIFYDILMHFDCKKWWFTDGLEFPNVSNMCRHSFLANARPYTRPLASAYPKYGRDVVFSPTLDVQLIFFFRSNSKWLIYLFRSKSHKSLVRSVAVAIGLGPVRVANPVATVEFHRRFIFGFPLRLPNFGSLMIFGSLDHGMIFLWIMEGVESLFMSVFEGRNWSPFAGSPGISWLAIARLGWKPVVDEYGFHET